MPNTSDEDDERGLGFDCFYLIRDGGTEEQRAELREALKNANVLVAEAHGVHKRDRKLSWKRHTPDEELFARFARERLRFGKPGPEFEAPEADVRAAFEDFCAAAGTKPPKWAEAPFMWEFASHGVSTGMGYFYGDGEGKRRHCKLVRGARLLQSQPQ